MYGWPVLDVITYMAIACLFMEAGQKSMPFPKTPAIALAVGLFLASVMSHVAHGYFQGVMITVPETFKLCLFLVLLLMVVNSVQRLRWVLFVFLIAAIVMAIHAIMQEMTGIGFAGQLPFSVWNQKAECWVSESKFFGIFDDPNDLGQFLATCMPLVFAAPKRLSVMTFLIGVCIVWLLADAMLATHSRGTLVGVVATVACMVFLLLPTRWLPYVGGLALIGGLVVCAFLGGALLDESARDRVMFWGEANQYFKHNPIFGGGFGLFEEISGSNRAAHNAFVLCYTELGLFGYWFWFNMLTLGVIGCWRTRVAFRHPATPEQAYLKRAAGFAIAAMTGFAASSYFLSRAYQFPLFFLFATLASIPVIARQYLPANHPPLINFRKDVLITGTLTSLSSVLYIYITILLLNR